MSDTCRSTDFPPLPMNLFMDALPRAVRSACDLIGLARPTGVYVELDEVRKAEFVANETVLEATHPCTPEALEKVNGLSGHHHISVASESCPVAIVATLRREFHKVEGKSLRVFWHLRAVRLPPPDEPGQLSLFS